MSTSASIAPTSNTDVESVTPYQVITLLLDGALERIDQAIGQISKGEIDEASVLIQKAMNIVNGLRESLDLNQGGEIASNLDLLYEYIIERLELIDNKTPLVTLEEVKVLLQEVYSGWVGISDDVEP